MISNALLTQAGVLPLRASPLRFAVGPPTGLTSNAWRVWTTNAGDLYILCRDNLKEAKVSFHASGRWRMGFTTEAVAKNANLLGRNENRAWEVWDQPQPTLPDTVVAFRLIFPTSELGVKPEQRDPAQWANVVYIEAAPPKKVTVITLFVTCGDLLLKHESEPSFRFASLDLGNGFWAQLVAHIDPEDGLPELIESGVDAARNQARSAGIDIPEHAYGYFFGRRDDGSRFLLGAHLTRVSSNELE